MTPVPNGSWCERGRRPRISGGGRMLGAGRTRAVLPRRLCAGCPAPGPQPRPSRASRDQLSVSWSLECPVGVPGRDRGRSGGRRRGGQSQRASPVRRGRRSRRHPGVDRPPETLANVDRFLERLRHLTVRLADASAFSAMVLYSSPPEEQVLRPGRCRARREGEIQGHMSSPSFAAVPMSSTTMARTQRRHHWRARWRPGDAYVERSRFGPTCCPSLSRDWPSSALESAMSPDDLGCPSR